MVGENFETGSTNVSPEVNSGSENLRVDRETSKFIMLSLKNRMRCLVKEPTYQERISLALIDINEGKVEDAKSKALEMHNKVDEGWNETGNEKIIKLMRLSNLEFRLGMTSEADNLFARGLVMFREGDSYMADHAIAVMARVAVKQGRQEDLIRRFSESKNEYLRNSVFYELGERLVENNEVDRAIELFNKIDIPWRKVTLGGRLVENLVALGRMDEAKTLINTCEVLAETENENQKKTIFFGHLLTGQSEKSQEILDWFDNKFKNETGHFRWWLDTASSYSKMLISAGQNDKARQVINRFESRIAEVLAGKGDDEWGGDKSDAKMSSGVIADLYLLLGEDDKAIESNVIYGKSYHINTAVAIAEALTNRGEAQKGTGVAVNALEDLTAMDSIETWYFEDLFKSADILVKNGYPTGDVLNLINIASRKVRSGDSAQFCFHLSNFKIEHFQNSGENIQIIDFRSVASRFVVDGKTNWLLVEQSAFVANSEEVKIILEALPEDDREKALTLIHKTALHYGTDYATENRSEIFARSRTLLISELKTSKEGVNDRDKVKTLVEMLVTIGDKEAKDLLLNLTQQEVDQISETGPNSNTLRLIKSLAELNTNRGNDFLFGVLGDARLGYHESMYLLRKLSQNDYISKDVFDWLTKRDNKRRGLGMEASLAERSAIDVQIIKLLIDKARLNPSEEILNMLAGEDVGDGLPDNLSAVERKIKNIQESRADVESAKTSNELISKLANDKEKAMAFYILNNGQTRFDLINNYSFEKFWEIITMTNQLKVHEGPIGEFSTALGGVGFSEEERIMIINNLKEGHNPFHSQENPSMEKTVRLDVANNQKYESAVKEIGNVFSKDQVGLALKSTFYRRYLSETANKDLLSSLNESSNLLDRLTAIEKIEKNHPEFVQRIIQELGPDWANLENKMSFGGVSLEGLLTQNSNVVAAEAVITKIEEKREELKLAKKGLISVLKNENPQVVAINKEILRKKKAVRDLSKGLGANVQLNERIKVINTEVGELESQVKKIGLNPIESRYATLSPVERKQKIDEENETLQALTEKDPSMVLMYLIAELAGGEAALTENDIRVTKEIGSHLEGPIQMVVDLAKLDKTVGAQRVEKTVRVRMLDKKDDLMTMVRFADSKICCFSSSNYAMRVAHNTENKMWVSSINKDPLSFVFEIEDVAKSEKETLSQNKNLGFVFGMYGVNEDGQPEVMLNGVYYANGNDVDTTINITGAIEEMLSQKVRAQHQFLSSMHGGKILGDLPDYSAEPVKAKRLRAIDDGEGSPVTKTYDDLGTQINVVTAFGGDILHKEIPISEEGKATTTETDADDSFKSDLLVDTLDIKPSMRERFKRWLNRQGGNQP